MELDAGAPEPAHAGLTLPAPVRSRRVRVEVQQLPLARDAGGYLLDERPLRLSGVSVSELSMALRGECPLGFPDVATWALFQDDLAVAFAAAGLTDVAARLGGSSRSFFSSPYTRTLFPQNLAELRRQVFAAPHNRDLDAVERADLWARSRAAYIEAGFLERRAKPSKHFWESRYRFGIDPEPCDYDIEVASDILDARMRLAAARIRAEHLGRVDDLHVAASTQWRAAAVHAEFPELAEFCARWTARLGRGVDLECFDGAERLRFVTRSDWWRLRGLD